MLTALDQSGECCSGGGTFIHSPWSLSFQSWHPCALLAAVISHQSFTGKFLRWWQRQQKPKCPTSIQNEQLSLATSDIGWVFFQFLLFISFDVAEVFGQPVCSLSTPTVTFFLKSNIKSACIYSIFLVSKNSPACRVLPAGFTFLPAKSWLLSCT